MFLCRKLVSFSFRQNSLHNNSVKMKKNKKKRRRKETIRFFLIVVLILLTIAAAVRLRLYVVMSGSMEPSLPVGSIVIVDTGDKKPECGDIITFRRGGTVVTHRVAGKSEGRYLTKGDANGEPDSVLTEPDRVIGTVCGWIPFPGGALLYFRKAGVTIPVLLLCLLFFSTASTVRNTAGNSESYKRSGKYEKK